MSMKKVLLLAVAGVLSATVVSAKPLSPREKRNLEKKISESFPVSSEARRLAAEYRRNPSSEARDALRRQVRKDYTQYVNDLRDNVKPALNSRHYHYRRKNLARMTHNRDRIVDEIVRRLIAADAASVSVDIDAAGESEKPASPKE